jgi:hypothetical protein
MAKISKNGLISLQKSLITDEAIGKKIGVTRQAIHQMRQKYGIPAIRDKHAKRDDNIRLRAKKGCDVAKIAAHFNLSVSQTYRIIRTKPK